MTRFLLFAAVLCIGLLVAPEAREAGFNSADAIVTLAPFAVFAIVTWPRKRPAPDKPKPMRWIEDIGEDHPDALGSLDRRDRGL